NLGPRPWPRSTHPSRTPRAGSYGGLRPRGPLAGLRRPELCREALEGRAADSGTATGRAAKEKGWLASPRGGSRRVGQRGLRGRLAVGPPGKLENDRALAALPARDSECPEAALAVGRSRLQAGDRGGRGNPGHVVPSRSVVLAPGRWRGP